MFEGDKFPINESVPVLDYIGPGSHKGGCLHTFTHQLRALIAGSLLLKASVECFCLWIFLRGKSEIKKNP